MSAEYPLLFLVIIVFVKLITKRYFDADSNSMNTCALHLSLVTGHNKTEYTVNKNRQRPNSGASTDIGLQLGKACYPCSR